jgi:steroid delta-isomerase-like uncharacterized protein
MTSSQNAATVLQMLDAAWNRGDTSVLHTTVAEDHIDHDDNGDDIGRDHLVQAILAYRAAFPDMRMSFDDQIADGDKVVTRWTANGTHQGQLDAIPATGRLARISGIFIHQLTDGEITESWTSFDRLGLLQQLGVIPSADSAPASAPLPLPPAGSAPPDRDGPLFQAAASRSPRACRRREMSALLGGEDLAELIGKLSRSVTEPGDVRAASEQGPRSAGNHPVGAGGEDLGDVTRGGPLQADAGGKEDPPGSSQVECRVQVGGTDDRSDRSDLARRQASIDLSDRDQQILFHRAAAAGGGGLDIAAFGIGRPGHHEEAASRLLGAGDQGAHGAHTEIGMDGEGVGSQGGAGPQVGLGVGVVGGPHVTPLGVYDNQQACAARFGDQPLQRPEPLPAVTFVECRLELDQAHGPRGRLERDVSEAVDAVRAVPDTPGIQNQARGIQAQGERTISRAHRGETGSERDGHGPSMAGRWSASRDPGADRSRWNPVSVTAGRRLSLPRNLP